MRVERHSAEIHVARNLQAHDTEGFDVAVVVDDCAALPHAVVAVRAQECLMDRVGDEYVRAPVVNIYTSGC